jgi:hypothetical protein
VSVYRPAGSKVWWYEFQFAQQRIRESTKTRSKTLAIEAQRNRRRELECAFNGVKKRASAKLFAVAADEWLVLKTLTLASSSIRIEKDNLKHIRPLLSQISRLRILPIIRRRVSARVHHRQPSTWRSGLFARFFDATEFGQRYNWTCGCSQLGVI